jgi:hypothetical protein
VKRHQIIKLHGGVAIAKALPTVALNAKLFNLKVWNKGAVGYNLEIIQNSVQCLQHVTNT